MKTRRSLKFTFLLLISLLLTFGFSRQFSNIFLISPEPILGEEVALAQTVKSKDQETKDKAEINEKTIAQFILRGSERTDETPLFDVKDIPFNKLPFPFNSPDVLALIVVYFLAFSLTLGLSLRVLAFALSPLTWIFGDYRRKYTVKSKEELYSENIKILRGFRGGDGNVTTQFDRIISFNLAQIEQYYQLNISQAVQSFRFSILLILIGTSIIAITVFFAITKDLEISVTIIPGISGIVLEIIGGSALLLYGKTIAQVNRFFAALLRDQDTMLAIDLCQKLKELKETEYIHATKQMISCLADRSSSLNLSLSNLDDSLTNSTNEKSNPLKKQEQKVRNDKTA